MVGTTLRANFFMNRFRKLFIEHNGGLKINNSLLRSSFATDARRSRERSQSVRALTRWLERFAIALHG